MIALKYKIIKSPVGDLKIVVRNKKLIAILWDHEKPNRVRLDEMFEDRQDPLLLETEKQLNEYFLTRRKTFNLSLDPSGTSFQEGVWTLLTRIPYGSTWSYQELAVKMNNPKAVRAVGSANGRNPISIIIPCHRVIASDGKIAGFAGGVGRKQFLLDLERDS